MQTLQLLGSNKHLQQPEIHTLIMQMTKREWEREREKHKNHNLLRTSPIKIL